MAASSPERRAVSASPTPSGVLRTSRRTGTENCSLCSVITWLSDSIAWLIGAAVNRQVARTQSTARSFTSVSQTSTVTAATKVLPGQQMLFERGITLPGRSR